MGPGNLLGTGDRWSKMIPIFIELTALGGGGLGKTDTNHINTNIPIDIDEASYDIIQCDRLKFVLRFMCPSP